MPVYVWTGKNRSDVTQKGEIEAVSEEAVKAQLIRQGLRRPKSRKNRKTFLKTLPFSSLRSKSMMLLFLPGNFRR
jgi:type IV pilus assembly protein PilC